MPKSSTRTATLVAGALGALVIALPIGGSAHADRYYDYDDYYNYNRPYYEPYYGGGQQWRDWQRLQHERQEMEEARQAGDWDRYREERREAKKAARALRHHRHHWHHDWDD